MISTHGSTGVHHDKYLSYFEDDFGNMSSKEINRHQVSHFLYTYFLSIDEHNKQCHNIFNMERNWCIKKFWIWILILMVGIRVVDAHSWS